MKKISGVAIILSLWTWHLGIAYDGEQKRVEPPAENKAVQQPSVEPKSTQEPPTESKPAQEHKPVSPPPQEDKVDKLVKELEDLKGKMGSLETKCAALEKEKEALKTDNTQLRQLFSTLTTEVGKVQELIKGQDLLTKDSQELRKLVSDFSSDLGKLKTRFQEFHPDPLSTVRPEFPIPSRPIKGTVLFVNKQDGKVVLKPGQDQGVQVGYRFKILRDGVPIATVAVEKVDFEGRDNRFSIARVVDGKIEDIKDFDAVEVILEQRPESTPKLDEKPSKLLDNPAPKPPPDTLIPVKMFKVQGVLPGGKYLVNVGKEDGIAVGDKLKVLGKDRGVKAVLVLESLEGGYSIAKIEESAKKADPETEDEVVVMKMAKPSESGKVILGKELVGISIGSKSGAKVGQLYEIHRAGQKVADVVVKEVHEDWSMVEMMTGYKREDVKEGDLVRTKP